MLEGFQNVAVGRKVAAVEFSDEGNDRCEVGEVESAPQCVVGLAEI